MRSNHNKNKDKKICFISYSFSSFIKQDYELLSKHFNIVRIQPSNIVGVLKLVTNILKTDISYSWFANEWAFISVLTSMIFYKKSVVVAGGYDVADEPEINYGSCAQNRLKQWMTKFALKHASVVLPVSKFTKSETEKYTSNNIKMIYNGIDTSQFIPSGIKEDMVLTVGNKSAAIRKGIDVFVMAAENIPDVLFVVVGMTKDEYIGYIPKNVTFTGHVTDEELIKYYQQSKVYCQLSFYEAFGMTTAESMGCGCIPVVSDRGGSIEVAGDVGYTVSYGNIKDTTTAIKHALYSTKQNETRDRIVSNFSIEKRENEIIDLIKKLGGRI
ncbi:MAG: glycosyltransferase family 4 protein [Methanosarcinales archaeon]|nr:glycosyltransferase family 4 protein [Methanosarcinales archaeon]